jgi:hypothetical protein
LINREAKKEIFNFIGGPILSDDDIRNIVQLAYHASLLPEEGRYPRFRLVFTPQSFGHGIRFSESWLGHRMDSPESIRRLAPVLVANGTALLIGTGFDGQLVAWQIADFERFCSGPPVTSNRLLDVITLAGGVLFLRVDGPGDFRAKLHPSPVFHLRGGEIRTLCSYYGAVEPFQTVVLSLCRELHNALKMDKRIEYFIPTPEVLADDFADLCGARLYQLRLKENMAVHSQYSRHRTRTF